MKLHKLISTVDMSHEEWLRYRKLGIGGSDAGSICGLNPYSSAIETMTNRRVYVTIDNRDNISAITYYDEENKRSKQIDLMHPHKNMIPHTHHGYLHNENDGAKGAANLTPKEKRMVESVTDKWYNRRGK